MTDEEKKVFARLTAVRKHIERERKSELREHLYDDCDDVKLKCAQDAVAAEVSAIREEILQVKKCLTTANGGHPLEPKELHSLLKFCI